MEQKTERDRQVFRGIIDLSINIQSRPRQIPFYVVSYAHFKTAKLIYFPHERERRHFISLPDRIIKKDETDRFLVEPDTLARADHFHVDEVRVSRHCRN